MGTWTRLGLLALSITAWPIGTTRPATAQRPALVVIVGQGVKPLLIDGLAPGDRGYRL